MYFQPVKDEDPHLDFYTMYKRESTEYDTEYMKKYNEDLNTTLIFVGFPCHPPPDQGTYHIFRPVCSPQSIPPSSSPFSRSSNQIPASGRKPTSVRSSSASTGRSHPVNTLQLPLHGVVPPRR